MEPSRYSTREEPSELVAFNLGEALAAMVFHAEVAWLHSDEYETVEQGLWSVKGSANDARRCWQLLTAKSRTSTVRAWNEAYVRFRHEIQARWNNRPACLAAEQAVEPEFQFECERVWILQKSPFAGSAYSHLRQATIDASKQLDSTQRQFLYLSAWLSSVLYPTFSRLLVPGARTGHVDDRRFWTGLSRAVRRALGRVTEAAPALTALDFMQRDDAQLTTSGAASRLMRDIRSALADPGRLPSYLGLVLDRPRRRVTRGRKCVELRRDALWDLLVNLVKSRDSYINWNDRGDRQAFERRCSDLRKVLRLLGLEIERCRNVGSRLALIRSPTN